ncbi:MAG: hypothetical protein DHS20C18_50700 [Saprospiraceae bacterium]|nr:MAG: hypothetical protein DHS20C18_50700 [Saprospiraceae bacterium]
MTFGLCFLLGGASLIAQQLELPQKSPKSEVSYVVGLTKVTINYSSPAVNDREVWGKLVPYDEVWRAGANEATTVEFSTDVKVEGENLAAGKYAFFLIPRKEGKWTAIFNKIADQWGAYNYDEGKDAIRVKIETKTAETSEERLNYTIVDQEIDRGYIRLGWEKQRAYILFRADVMAQVANNVNKSFEAAKEEDKWSVYAQASDFYADHGELLKALDYAEKSIKLGENSRNLWAKAKVEAKMEKYKDAIKSAKKALDVGAKAEGDRFYNNYKQQMNDRIAEWEALAKR